MGYYNCIDYLMFQTTISTITSNILEVATGCARSDTSIHELCSLVPELKQKIS